MLPVQVLLTVILVILFCEYISLKKMMNLELVKIYDIYHILKFASTMTLLDLNYL